MITLLALRNLAYRPWRSALLLGGYALGVGVMIVLLAIGEALLTQARDERLVGGGTITVLPEGLDVEVMKTGGVGGLFFSIDRARFIYRQLLAAPRLGDLVRAAAPQVDGKLLYLRTADGAERGVRATGEIPSRTRLVGAALPLAAGAWDDDDGDRRWIAPTPRELYSEMDHFHRPSAALANRESWGEWHYFNVIGAERERWAFISYIVGGDVAGGEWGGQFLVSVRDQGGRTRRFLASVPAGEVAFSTSDPDLVIGEASVRLLDDGRYAITGRAREEGGSAELSLDLTVTPAPRAYFPGAELAGCAAESGSCAFASGYVVPALRASASGTLCIAGACERHEASQAYHDHNWGIWRGVTWEWGAGRAGEYGFLYGRVQPPEDAGVAATSLFVYVVDSLGFLAVFRPRAIAYEDARTIVVDGRPVRVPARALFGDARGNDTLRVELVIEDAIATDTRRPLAERGDLSVARRLTTPYFIQMKGTAHLSGRVQGKVLAGTGTGFFETYR